MNNSQKAEVFPVAHFIKEEMEARGWTLEDLLNLMPGNKEENRLHIELILSAPEFDEDIRKNISIGDASAIAAAFETSSEFWTNLDNAWVAHQNK